jgi:hypothetical protein
MNDERTFRLSEAQEMLPLLDALLAAALALRLEARNVEALIQAVRRSAGSDGSSLQTDSRELESKLRGLVKTMQERVEAINEMGVQIKDLDRGLVDWVGLRDGRKVYICWERGEPAIAFWHELDDGFEGRQPIQPEEWD